MIPSSVLHVHSTLCDGENTPEEMIEAAIAAGFCGLGLSSHATEIHYPQGSIKNEEEYVKTIHALKEKYSSKINLWCGLEQDITSPVKNRAALDYLIGSVHYIWDKDITKCFCIDSTPEAMELGIKEYFGSGIKAAKRYYELLAENVRAFAPDIIGHFDLIVKLNRGGRFFDEESSEYISSAVEAARECAKSDKIFEVNTNGVYKRYRDAPYPALFILKELKNVGARMMINTDSHAAESIGFYIPESLELLRTAGFKEIWEFDGAKFVERGI